MTREELLNLNEKDLKARLKAIRQESQTAAGEALDALVEEADIIDSIMKDIANRRKLAGMAAEEEMSPNPGEGKEGEEGDVKNKAREERGKSLGRKYCQIQFQIRFNGEERPFFQPDCNAAAYSNRLKANF